MTVLEPASIHADILLEGADGSTLSLDVPARRLITLSPHLTELVFAAGAGERIIATVEYSEFPAAAADIPRVGDAFRLDTERIVALGADLVIAWDSGNPRPAVAQLRHLGVPVWPVEIRSPAEIADVLEDIGRAVENTGPAGREADRIRERLARLSQRYEGVESLDYFYQVGQKPLFTINGDHLISMGLDLCGGHNVFSGEPGLAFQVSHESVIVANPHALFAPWQQDTADPLAGWRDWPAMKAVRRDALYLLPADSVSRATPRFLDSLELACKLLHGLQENHE